MSVSNGAYTRTQGFGQTVDPCRPIFYEEPVQTGEIDGRKTYKMVERVKIIMPGNQHTIPVLPVTGEHRERWPKEYEAFKKGVEPDLNGIPLEDWAILNKAQVLELKSMNIRTIEDMAGLADFLVQKIGRGGYALRERAKAYLDEAKAGELETKLTAENEAMREELATLRNTVEQLSTMVEAQGKQIVATGDAQNPLATIAPAALDINQRNKPILATQESSSSLDGLAAVKRRPGRPRKADAA